MGTIRILKTKRRQQGIIFALSRLWLAVVRRVIKLMIRKEEGMMLDRVVFINTLTAK